MTDNACAYTHNRSPAELLAERGIKHLTTEPHRPRTNRWLASEVRKTWEDGQALTITAA